MYSTKLKKSLTDFRESNNKRFSSVKKLFVLKSVIFAVVVLLLVHVSMKSPFNSFGLVSMEDARYYVKSGERVMPSPVPYNVSFSIGSSKLNEFVKSVKDLKQKTFILYNVGLLDVNESPEVASNNIAIFLSAAKADPVNFYWFNVMAGDNNQLRGSLPDEKALPRNIAVVAAPSTPTYLYLHMLSLVFLEKRIKYFGSVFFLNHGVRGPIVDSSRLGNGAWLQPFRNLLFSSTSSSKVGMVGSSLSCEGVPHVQTHAFMLLSELVPAVAEKYEKIRTALPTDWQPIVAQYEVGLSAFIEDRGYRLASLLYQSRETNRNGVFSGSCIDFTNVEHYGNPTEWCNIDPKELIFMYWSNDILLRGHICDKIRKTMRLYLAESARVPNLNLRVPERLRMGVLGQLLYQYEQEMLLESVIPISNISEQSAKSSKSGGSKSKLDSDSTRGDVCFVVRTALMHDPSVIAKQPVLERDESSSLDEFIRAMQRQTDPHWQAHFIITDEKPFEARLQSLLAEYRDSRLQYLEVGREARPEYSKQDAGYTATDTALHRIINNADYSSCRWIVVTNADNIYGSAVVSSARQHSPEEFEMLLAPMDSRNILWNEMRLSNKKKMNWDSRCGNLVNSIEYRSSGLAIQPIPQLAHVDLAAVFFNRQKWQKENVLFSSFTNKRTFPPCIGCQDGHLTQYLVEERQWRFKQLPLDGLRSILFHGPSPLWCVSSGKTWFAPKDLGKMRCFSAQTISLLYQVDVHTNKVFDWGNFESNQHICLRLSFYGFKATTSSSTYTDLANVVSLFDYKPHSHEGVEKPVEIESEKESDA